MSNKKFKPSIAPWLTVPGGANAIGFYKSAFGAVETYRLESPDGALVARLSIDGAEFWMSEGSKDDINSLTGGGPIRMILTVADPDKFFERAINAGAVEIFPVGEEHGWRLGRLADQFGHHWEIGRPLTPV